VNPIRWLTILVVVGAGLATPWARLTARDAPTPPSLAATAYLPDPAALGDGWQTVRTARLDLPSEAFREGAVGVYVGPDGARVMAVIMLATQSRVAVRRSWEEAAKLFAKHAGELAAARNRSAELDALPPPAGCVEAKRIDGSARQLRIDTGIPMGITLCATDPDVIVLVVASGVVGDLTGHQASDAVASLLLGAIGSLPAIATPVAATGHNGRPIVT
jgi:hypothetical protein